MTHAAAAPAAPPRGPVHAWVWGGALLIGSALAQLAMMTVQATGPGLHAFGLWSGMLAFAAATIVFAWGLRGHGSVVARQRMGMVALFVVGLWPIVAAVVMMLLPSATTAAQLEVLGVWSTVDGVVWLAAALLAVVAIARAGAVPGWWRWAPATGLAVVLGSWVLVQVVAVSVGWAGVQVVMPLLQLQAMVTVLVPVALGIVAIVLGLTPRGAPHPAPPVPVYPPPEQPPHPPAGQNPPLPPSPRHPDSPPASADDRR